MPIKTNPIITGYYSMVEDRLERGYLPTILTFMFKEIPGPAQHRAQVMVDIIDRFHGRLLNRAYSRPWDEPTDRKPFLLGSPDWPVWKGLGSRDHLMNISINDGLHFHMLALMPTDTRLGAVCLEHYLDENAHLYVKPFRELERIHTRTVTETPEKVVSYVLKSVDRRRIDTGDILLLPRAQSELRDRGSMRLTPRDVNRTEAGKPAAKEEGVRPSAIRPVSG